MSATIGEIIDLALTVVGEVTGPGVQTYEEDRMRDDASRAFDMMFKKYDWHQYLKWFTVTLNGTTVTSDGMAAKTVESLFAKVRDFEDFVAIHRDQESNRLPIAPTRMNPATLGTVSARALYWTSMNALETDYETKKLIFYPSTATGTLQVLAKVHPKAVGENFVDADRVYLDRDMLVYATAFMTLSGDDLNAQAASVVQGLMEMKYRDVIAALAKHPIPIRGDHHIPNTWQVV